MENNINWLHLKMCSINQEKKIHSLKLVRSSMRAKTKAVLFITVFPEPCYAWLTLLTEEYEYWPFNQLLNDIYSFMFHSLTRGFCAKTVKTKANRPWPLTQGGGSTRRKMDFSLWHKWSSVWDVGAKHRQVNG